MGLESWVYCNCIKEGKAPPHPFPELLAFDERGEATLKSQGEISLELWLTHDKWYRNSCSHSGHLIEKRIGNIALVAHVRRFLEGNSPNEFSLLLERVVYDGVHSGDWIAARDVPQLMGETRKLQSIANRSTSVRAKPTGLGQRSGDGVYDRGSNAAGPRADGGEQESLLAERRELGNNLGERKVESAWPGKATGRDTVNATISMRTGFLVGTGGNPGGRNDRVWCNRCVHAARL